MTCVMVAPAGKRIGVATGTTGSLSGTITDNLTNPVPNSLVSLTPNSGSVLTALTNGSGVYSISGIDTTKTWTIKNEPPFRWSIGSGQSYSASITINPGSNTHNFSCLAALWTRDWQDTTSTSNLKGSVDTGQSPHETAAPLSAGQAVYGFPNVAKCYWSGNNEAQFSLGTWSDASQCMRVDVPDRSAQSSSYFPACQASASTASALSNKSELWLRWLDFWSLGFTPGGGGNVGSGAEYKSLFLDLGANVSIQIEWENRNGGAPDDLIGVRMKMITPLVTYPPNPGAVTDGIFPGTPDVLQKDYQPARGDLLNSANTWVLGLTGIGTTDTYATLYRNGTQIIQLHCNWLGNGNYPTVHNIQFGANFNGGPNAACYRLWRQFSEYFSQPSMITGII